MSFPLLEKPLFEAGGHYVTFLGLIAFAGFFAAGLVVARFLQSEVVRRFFSRFKMDTNFIAIVTTILSLASIVFFTVTAINAAGIPLAWNAPLPAIKLSLVQIFLLVALLVGVFWFSSGTKRFLFNRLLAQSGLDRSLQYAIAQVVSNIVLVVGIVIVLENTGIHLAALAVFAGAVGVGVGFGLQNIASNFISGLVILAERPITIGDRVEVAGIAGQVAHENPHTLKDPAPNVFLEQFGDNSIDFKLMVWSSEMSARPSRYRSDLNFAIAQKFREAGIEFPFPQRDVHIRDGVLKVENVTAEANAERTQA